jgi:serine/threonine-protein kinase
MTNIDPAVPERLGDYEPVERIGRGPYCVVWRARRAADGAEFALKVLEPRYAGDERRAARFEAEARLSLSLRHPHVVRVHEVVVPPRSALPFFVMDLMTGGQVGQFRGCAPGEFPRLVRIFIEVCEALEYIHAAGLVHCDVKPSNVLLDGAGKAALADFGMAASPEQIAEEGAQGGTIAYMAPEQGESLASDPGTSPPVDARSDIYAVGAMMYEVFTGEPPFRGSNRFALMYQRSKADPRPPAEVRPEVPEPLSRAILRAMARSPADRFPSAAALAGALGAVGLI